MIQKISRDQYSARHEEIYTGGKVSNFPNCTTQKIHQIDKNIIIVSWKNSEGFTTMNTNPEECTNDIAELAKYFNGYRANLKEGRRNYFKF